MKRLATLLAIIVALPALVLARDVGDLLADYLSDPKGAIWNDLLALVEIGSVDVDSTPEDGWSQTGTIHFKTIETVQGNLPSEFSVRFYKREPVVDVWTWDDAMLESGKRLIGFFFFDEYGNLGVRKDGRKNVINNVEQIDRELLLQLQSQFTTPLFEEPETSAEEIEDHS